MRITHISGGMSGCHNTLKMICYYKIYQWRVSVIIHVFNVVGGAEEVE